VTDVEISASHMGRWKRVVGIVLVVTFVASAVGCLMFFVEWVVSGLSNERIHVSLGRLPAVAWQAVSATGMVGLPVAFATGVLFALWYAILAAIIVLMLSQFLPAMIPVWQMEPFWLTHILIYLAVPSIVSWLILRRWTSLLQS
jgi:hypothetical protein